MEKIKYVIKIYRKAINPPYSRRDLIAFLTTFIVILLLQLPLVFIMFGKAKDIKVEAVDVKPKTSTQFISNELLVKVKKEAKTKIKEGPPSQVGISSLNKINTKFNVKEFKKIAWSKQETNQEIFSWYKVSLPIKQEVIEGRLDKDSKKLTAKKDVGVLQDLIGEFSQDPNIEVVEPNYVVTALVTPNDPYFRSSGSWGQAYPDLWGIKKINPEVAWDQKSG